MVVIGEACAYELYVVYKFYIGLCRFTYDLQRVYMFYVRLMCRSMICTVCYVYMLYRFICCAYILICVVGFDVFL